MDKEPNSTYELLTKLCEKFITAGQNQRSYPKKSFDLKKVRSKCYEILLSKRSVKINNLNELENIKDPLCHLLAWQFQLLNKYNLPHHAGKLRVCSEKLQKLNAFEDKTLSNVLFLLLELRQVPAGEEKIMETTIDRNCTSENATNRESIFPCFHESQFHLSNDVSSTYIPFQNENFKLHNKKVVLSTSAVAKLLNDNKRFTDTPSQTTLKMKHFETELKPKPSPINIWEYVAKEPFTKRHTWEEFGHFSTIKEPPFLCESNAKASEYVQNLLVNFESITVQTDLEKQVEVPLFVEFKDFIKDAQHLLVGMESKTFKYNAENKLALVTGVRMQGLSAGTIRSYCKDLVFCSHCYTGLDQLCTPNSLTLSYVNNGYIFTELCESIKNYLSYYRVAIFSITNTTNLLAFNERTKQLRNYTTTLASVCKVGPFTESGEIPHGVALLNYLYQKVMCVTNKDILMVLYSVLYPCCQVYFSRFLQRWILEGSINDPYGEFFISINSKYVNSKGRTYWTRSYTVLEDIVPDFIAELSPDILLCGKAMNLLKLCVPNSPLSVYLNDKQSNIVCCCIMSEQLQAVESNNHYYYLEATALSGPRLCMSHIISRRHEQDKVFLNLVAKKRAATLCRIELERKREAELIIENRRVEMKMLQDQYAQAQKDKQLKMLQETQQEILAMEKNMRIQSLHDKIIQEEASNLIDYYNDLFEASESKREFYEKRIKSLRKVELSNVGEGKHFVPLKYNSKQDNSDSKLDLKEIEEEIEIEDLVVEKPASASVIELHIKESNDFVENSIADVELNPKESQTLTHKTESSETFLSGHEDYLLNRSEEFVSAHSLVQSVEDLDVENANYDEQENTEKDTDAMENFKLARRNKARVMASEFGMRTQEVQETNNVRNINLKNQLTEAQRNKLRVMSSEFDINVNSVAVTRFPSTAEVNKNKILSSSECFYPKDNEKTKDVNKNDVKDSNANLRSSNKWATQKQDMLSLDFSKIGQTKNVKTIISNIKSPKFELDKISPMSVDSTSSLFTPLEKVTGGIENYDFEYAPSSCTTITATASTGVMNLNEAFDFEKPRPLNLFQLENCKFELAEKMDNIYFSKNISMENTEFISSNCLKLCLQQSISIPLITQIKLVTNELLKYFINNLQYLQHLDNLRNYFFLMDGEFGRHMTEGLFEKLYESNFPIDLINCNSLQSLVYKALDYSTKCQEDRSCLSFRINSLPKKFDLANPDVFDCISLTYKVNWPLNILLPSETITRYDEIFKFLLKLHRMTWILKNLFQNLKSLAKENKFDKERLLKSPQYRRLHQCRHVMTHFIQTLQNYIVSEVLQTNWEILEKNLESVVNFDQLYILHTAYIKNILFMCLLHQKMILLRRVLQKIFTVILKFYDFVRRKMWTEEDGDYVHPSFVMLENIFQNFEELVTYFFKACHKVAKSGYQANIIQLLNMLDINNYYSQKC